MTARASQRAAIVAAPIREIGGRGERVVATPSDHFPLPKDADISILSSSHANTSTHPHYETFHPYFKRPKIEIKVKFRDTHPCISDPMVARAGARGQNPTLVVDLENAGARGWVSC